MPNWENYYYSYDATNVVTIIDTQIQRYEELKREHEQILCEEIQRIEDRKKYPLFFWRELTNGNT